MLLLNRTLLRMARGLWGWILAIAGLKLLTLVGTATFAGIVSGYLGNLTSPQLTLADAGMHTGSTVHCPVDAGH